MVNVCEKCGLPPDLCMCNATTGLPMPITPRDARFQIMSPIRPQRCTKCGKSNLQYSEVAERMCLCCGIISKFHIGCGGRVEEYDIFERKY